MSGFPGRLLQVKRGGTLIAAIVSKSISINNEAIDVTTDDDDGFRTLLETPGVRTIDISFEGVMRTDAMPEAIVNGTLISAVEVEFPSGMTINGSFRLNSLEISGETADKIKFSGELQSTGEFTLTPAA